MGKEPQESDDLRAELIRSIIPELAEDGYIEWDPASETIRRGPRFDEIEPFLEAMDHPDDLPID